MSYADEQKEPQRTYKLNNNQLYSDLLWTEHPDTLPLGFLKPWPAATATFRCQGHIHDRAATQDVLVTSIFC